MRIVCVCGSSVRNGFLSFTRRESLTYETYLPNLLRRVDVLEIFSRLPVSLPSTGFSTMIARMCVSLHGIGLWKYWIPVFLIFYWREELFKKNQHLAIRTLAQMLSIAKRKSLVKAAKRRYEKKKILNGWRSISIPLSSLGLVWGKFYISWQPNHRFIILRDYTQYLIYTYPRERGTVPCCTVPAKRIDIRECARLLYV